MSELTAQLNVRKETAAALRKARPDWGVINIEKAPDQISKPTVLISQRTIGPLPEAPANFTVGLSLILYVPNQDMSKAEDALDELAIDLWELLTKSATLNPTSATKGTFQTYLAYTFAVDAIVTKD